VTQSFCLAILASCCGEKYCARSSSGAACEISQFWQNLQFTLQPPVAMESARSPG
jgi:hypothetical protein